MSDTGWLSFRNTSVSDPSDLAEGFPAWTDPASALVSDNQYATAVLSRTSAGDTYSPTEYLITTNLTGLSLPTGSTINGVEFAVHRKGSSVTTCSVVDRHLKIVKSGVIQSDNQASATSWPTAESSATYGGSSYLWGISLTSADVASSSFGMAISAKLSSPSFVGSRTASIDYVACKIHYTPPTGSPIPTLTVASSSGSKPFAASFSTSVVSGVAPYTYNWAYGDGSTEASGSAAEVHVYSGVGSFTCGVTVWDSSTPSLSGYSSVLVTSTGTSDLSSVFSVNPNNGAATLVVTGTVTSFLGSLVSRVGTGGGYYHTLYWGDGGMTTGENWGGTGTSSSFQHSYTSAGTYRPYAKTVDFDGNSTYSASATVTVLGGPLSISASVLDNTSGPPPLYSTYYANIQGGTPPYSVIWNFDNGGTSTKVSPIWVHSSYGSHTATAIASDALAATASATLTVTVTGNSNLTLVCTGSVLNISPGGSVTFLASASGGVGPMDFEITFGGTAKYTFTDFDLTTALSTSWTFGGVGMFPVQITVTDATGVSDSKTLYVNSTGTASAWVYPRVTKVSGDDPLTITCSAVARPTSDPISYYQISWGDGTSTILSTSYASPHTYDSPGIYLGEVLSVGTDGTRYTSPFPVTVGISETSSAVFTWTGSDSPDATSDLVYAYYLYPASADFGGWTSTGSASFQGLSPGSYTFNLKAKDLSGNQSPVASWPFAVGDAHGLNVSCSVTSSGQFDPTPYGTTNYSAGFEVIATGASAGTFSMDFGDGASFTSTFVENTPVSTSHTYAATGCYRVTVFASSTISTKVGRDDHIVICTGPTHVSSGVVTRTNHTYFTNTYSSGEGISGVAYPWEDSPESNVESLTGASVTLPSSGVSEYLYATMPADLNIPATSITSATLRLRMRTLKSDGTTPTVSGVALSSVRMIRAGSLLTETLTGGYLTIPPSGSVAGFTTYSFPNVGTGWASGDFTGSNLSGTGVRLQMYNDRPEELVAYVDSIRLQVHYTGAATGSVEVATELRWEDEHRRYYTSSNATGGFAFVTVMSTIDEVKSRASAAARLVPAYITPYSKTRVYSPCARVSVMGSGSSASVTDLEFDSMPAAYPLIRPGERTATEYLQTGQSATWKYYMTMTYGPRPLRVSLTKIQENNVDLYVRKNSIPTETYFDGSSTSTGLSNETVTVGSPPALPTYWYIGVKCTATNGFASYRLAVDQDGMNL